MALGKSFNLSELGQVFSVKWGVPVTQGLATQYNHSCRVAHYGYLELLVVVFPKQESLDE